jgi:hypothetical protein
MKVVAEGQICTAKCPSFAFIEVKVHKFKIEDQKRNLFNPLVLSIYSNIETSTKLTYG